MKSNEQKKFYAAVGKACQTARKNRNMTIAGLANKSGEQHKTIVMIEKGNCHSMHHAVWMRSVLGLDINEILKKYMEGNSGEEVEIRFRVRERSIDDYI